MLFVAIFSQLIFSAPAKNYHCHLTAKHTLESTKNLFEIEEFSLQFQIPEKNKPRKSPIENVVTQFSMTTTDLVARGKFEYFTDQGTLEFGRVHEIQGHEGFLYSLGETELIRFTLATPRLAKNLRKTEKVEIWILNKMRRILLQFEAQCTR